MLKDIKNTAKHSIVYAIGNMGMKFVGLLLIPLYTNTDFLTTNEYGALTILEASLQVLVGLLSFAMAGSLSRWYWDKDFLEKQKSIFFTCFSFLIVIIVPAVLTMSYFSLGFSQLIFNRADYAILIRLTIFTAGIQVVNQLVLTLLRLQSKSIFFVVVQLFKLFGLFGLILWGLKFRGLGLIAVWQAYLIIEGAVLVLFIPVIIRNIHFKFQAHTLKEMLSYGLPLMLASISGVILSVTDRYMLNSMQGLERAGIYSLGYRIANTLKMVVTYSLSLALVPIQMKKIGQEGCKRFFSKIMKYSSFLFSLAMLALSLFSLEILKVIARSQVYWEANGIIALVAVSLFFGQLKDNSLIGLTVMKKTKITGTLVFITSILNLGLNFFLIPYFDIYGAAVATMLSQFFFFITVYLSAQKVYRIPYEIRNTITMFVVLILFVIIGLSISEMNTFFRLVIKTMLLIGYPFVLLAFRYYDEVEKENMKNLYKVWSKPSQFKENFKRFLN